MYLRSEKYARQKYSIALLLWVRRSFPFFSFSGTKKQQLSNVKTVHAICLHRFMESVDHTCAALENIRRTTHESHRSLDSSRTSYVFFRINKDMMLSFDSDKGHLDLGASKESINLIGARSNFIGSFMLHDPSDLRSLMLIWVMTKEHALVFLNIDI